MGALTLDQVKERVRVRFGNRNDADFIAQLSSWINDAYQYMCQPSVKEWPEMRFTQELTLVADQSRYEVTAGANTAIVGIHNVYYYNATTRPTTGDAIGVQKSPLRPRDRRWADQRSTHNGQPGYYTFDESKDADTRYLDVYPAPGTTEAGKMVVVRCWRTPTLLAIGTDVTVLPASYDQVLVQGAIAFTMAGLPGYSEDALWAQHRMDQLLVNAPDQREIGARDWGHRADVRSESYIRTNS